MTPEEQAAADQQKRDADAAKAAADKAAADKATADKAAADKAAADKAAADAAAAAKPPEKYDLKLADGSPLDPSDIDKMATYAKSKGLSNEQAQQLLDQRHESAASLVAKQKAFLETTIQQWLTDTKADKDLGGANYPVTERNMKRVMDRFAPEGSAFRQLVNATGYGNHPEFVRFVNAIGKAMAEDTPLGAGAGAGGDGKEKKSLAERMFPEHAKT